MEENRELSAMESTTPTMEQLAADYGCTSRTLRTLKRNGVNLSDPEAVTQALIRQRSRSLPMLQRLDSILDQLPAAADQLL